VREKADKELEGAGDLAKAWNPAAEKGRCCGGGAAAATTVRSRQTAVPQPIIAG